MQAYRLSLVIVAHVFAVGCIPLNIQAREYFNPAMLELDNSNQKQTDLTVFEEASSQPPGVYRVDIYLNDELKDTRDVEFTNVKFSDGNVKLQPCLKVAFLNEMGVKTDLFSGIGHATSTCAKLSTIPQATAEFRFNTQQLLLSIPQAAISQKARGYLPDSQWDEGVTALLLNYSLNGAERYGRNSTTDNNSSQYANLRPGINIGPWRLRNYSTFAHDSQGQEHWDTVYTYAQRNIVSLKSQLTLGDSSSQSDVFDSIPFRGAQLASDNDMIPDSLKGYAPVIRGIARTNAQVIIRQNGYIIYQSYVAPGAFEINDMFPTGGSGDLHVTIKEADGSQQESVVPFASLPVLQREGRLKYSLTGGQYRSYNRHVNKTMFTQGTAIYGLPAGFTGYGGGQLAKNYKSLSLGIGKNLGDIGALSTDVTQAWSTIENVKKSGGQSWRIRYSKNIIQTGTNFSIAGYRYSTEGYYSLQDVLDTDSTDRLSSPVTERKKNRTEVTLTQNLWDQSGSLSLSLINENYWGSNRSMRSIGAGYNNTWNGISYGLNYSHNENVSSGDWRSGKTYDRDNMFAFNISIPLNNQIRNAYATYNMNSSQKGSTTHNIGLTGTALEDNNLNWGIQQGYGNRGQGANGNLNADYRGTYGEVTGGYAYDRNSQRLNYGLQGGIVAYQDGIVFGQPLGETLTVVKAKGARGVSVINQTGVKTDWRGYAIVPYSSPYRKNQVQLNTETMPDDVDITLTSQNVVPTRGAVVVANFEANIGLRVFMALKDRKGEPIPFGAMVSDLSKKGSQSFIVGDKGQVYLSGMEMSGSLLVKWGKHGERQCHVSYRIPETLIKDKNIVVTNADCI